MNRYALGLALSLLQLLRGLQGADRCRLHRATNLANSSRVRMRVVRSFKVIYRKFQRKIAKFSKVARQVRNLLRHRVHTLPLGGTRATWGKRANDRGNDGLTNGRNGVLLLCFKLCGREGFGFHVRATLFLHLNGYNELTTIYLSSYHQRRVLYAGWNGNLDLDYHLRKKTRLFTQDIYDSMVGL